MKKIAILIVVLFIALGSVYFLLSNSNNLNFRSPAKQAENENNIESRNVDGYQGSILAGSTSPFIEFNKADYEKAKSERKIILLDFYASWCPICRAEEPAIKAGFNSLTDDQIVGFRVNFNDPDTDEDERLLAKEFNVPYQHTKIAIVNGLEAGRYTNQLTEDDLQQLFVLLKNLN